ncbi:hypothetical protein DFH06DRAFT_1255186 [Mycena polygramma]|nr:hypothetical protein DFH06DRAFT_1255186 [Mycena polygramma]
MEDFWCVHTISLFFLVRRFARSLARAPFLSSTPSTPHLFSIFLLPPFLRPAFLSRSSLHASPFLVNCRRRTNS